MITFHRARNIGANLQAYSMNQYINDHIARCEIIDFYPNNQTAHRKKIRKFLSCIKSILLYRKRAIDRKFSRFQKKYYTISSKTYYGDADLMSNPPQYDLLLSGSDQILNTTLSDVSQSYYLSFENRTKKISYASSFGRTELSEKEYSLIDVELRKFKHLSVREESAKKIIEERIGATVELVLDPVFLLSANEWEQIQKKIKVPDDYILVYAMEVTSGLIDIVNKACEEYSLPVFVIYGCSDHRVLEGTVISDCGPQEFISYINKAKFVITNSFHGTAFSIVFKKNFICVSHSSRNARLENIMTLIDEGEKLVNFSEVNSVIIDYIIDGAIALKRLASYIEKSKKYLREACQEQAEEQRMDI